MRDLAQRGPGVSVAHPEQRQGGDLSFWADDAGRAGRALTTPASRRCGADLIARCPCRAVVRGICTPSAPGHGIATTAMGLIQGIVNSAVRNTSACIDSSCGARQIDEHHSRGEKQDAKTGQPLRHETYLLRHGRALHEPCMNPNRVTYLDWCLTAAIRDIG